MPIAILIWLIPLKFLMWMYDRMLNMYTQNQWNMSSSCVWKAVNNTMYLRTLVAKPFTSICHRQGWREDVNSIINFEKFQNKQLNKIFWYTVLLLILSYNQKPDIINNKQSNTHKRTSQICRASVIDCKNRHSVGHHQRLTGLRIYTYHTLWSREPEVWIRDRLQRIHICQTDIHISVFAL